MPGEAGAESRRVERISRHGEVLGIHEMTIQMLVLGEETQANQADIEIGIDIDNRIIADQGSSGVVRLQAEL